MSFSPVKTVLISDGANSALYSALTTANIAEGDIAIINRAGVVLQDGATPTSAAGNDVIQIIQGLSAGVSKKSPLIPAKGIKGYSVAAYTAPTQQVITVGSDGSTGSITAVNSALYKLTINLKTSTNLLPNQQAKYIFFYEATSAATQDEIAAALVSKINADRNASSLFTAAKTTETDNRGITITGKAVPADAYGINKSEFVTFEVHFSYTSDSVLTPTAASSGIETTTDPVIGNGTYAQVLDMWKDSIGYDGYTNWTQFPVAALPAGGPVSTATYSLITLRYDGIDAGDLQGTYRSPQVITIAVATGSTALAAITAVLDDYTVACGVDKK